MRVTGSVRRWQERLLHHNLGTEVSRFADRFRPKYRFLDEEDCELLEGFSEDSYSRPSSPIQPPFNLLRDHVNPLIIVLALSWIVGLYFAFPSPTTIPVFIGAAIGVTSWTLFSWFRIALLMFRSKQFSTSCFASWPVRCRIGLATCTFLVIYWISRGLIPPAELVPPLLSSHPGVPERYFIAANLYNNEAVFNDWSSQLLKLSRHREYRQYTLMTAQCAENIRSWREKHLHLHLREQQLRQYQAVT